jgi:hypothetical protein
VSLFRNNNNNNWKKKIRTNRSIWALLRERLLLASVQTVNGLIPTYRIAVDEPRSSATG